MQAKGNCVKLRAGSFQDAYEKCYRYYQNIPAEDILYELRKRAGLDTRGGKSLHNEEGSWFRLGGDVIGQWMQAYCAFYETTQDYALKQKLNALLDGLEEVMEHNKCLYSGLFMYYFEKYLKGFCDAFRICRIEKGIKLACRLLQAAIDSDIFQNAALRLGDNGPTNEIEWYTILESVCVCLQLLRAEKREPDLVSRAQAFFKKFEYQEFWDIFYKKKNLFEYSPIGGQNSAYFHAYSHLNSFNSAKQMFLETGDRYYLKSIKNFYAFMRAQQETATGGFGTHLEWLLPKTGIIQAITNFHDNFETQCDTYAVVRLSNFLLSYEKDGRYGGWAEKLLYNATLASLDIDEKGHTFYYSDYCLQGGSKFLHPNTWTCCTGTRPLLVNEFKNSIYFFGKDAILIHLLVPSELQTEDGRIQIETKYPAEDDVWIDYEAFRKKSIKIRAPEFFCTIEWERNGKRIRPKNRKGWYTVPVSGSGRIRMRIRRHLEKFSIQVGKYEIAAINYGSVTLAAEYTSAPLAASIDFSKDLDEQFIQEDALHFRLKSNAEILFKPFYEYQKDEKYRMYFDLGGNCFDR